MMKKTVLCMTGVLLLGGCCLFDRVPPGKPPEGVIVRNAPRKKFDVRSAVNYMTTSLSIHLLSNPPPENFAVTDGDGETLEYARMVLEELRHITGIREKMPPGRLVFKTRSTADGWDFALLLDGKTVWQEHLDLNRYNISDQSESSVEK